jgi:catechol 2,3-dioxygenase-like lactoylglutathione lyase family enzyme
MAQVIGLGGVFYKVADTERTKRWYQETLGLGGEWGIMLPWKADESGEAFSLFSTFKQDTDYFAPSTERFMVNFLVKVLDGLIAELQGKGIEILGRQEEDYGSFAWILDCDGLKLELWEQKSSTPG